MDLNYLYHRRGVSLLMAEHASCDAVRRTHLSFASAYALAAAKQGEQR